MKVERVNKTGSEGVEIDDDTENAGFALLAHDVRSSMFGLLGSLELIDTQNLAPETRDRLERAKTSGALLGDLLGLVFGSMGAGEKSGPLDVNAELKLLNHRWFDQASSANVVVDIGESSDNILIDVIDRVGFHRIFNNLIGNSIKFGQNGHISLSVKSVEEFVVFIVEDDGPGFSEESLRMLFEFRGRPQGSPKEGSGLGLFISKTLVSEAGGEIHVENGASRGAKITVKLPKSRTEKLLHTKKPDALPDLRHLNILLAEDNVTNQLVVTQMLASMGAKFSVASDGVEALEMFENGDFDAVLLDIEMPRKSGLEVLREIRSREDRKSGLPLIALTAYVMPEHRQKIDAAGADGLIAKPIAGIATLGHQILEFVHGIQLPTGAISPPAEHGAAGFIDREIYSQLSETIGAEFLPEFLEKVILDFESIDVGLAGAKDENDFEEMRAQSHILISIAGAIGATSLQRLAQELNGAARGAVAQKTDPLNSACRDGIVDVLTFLKSTKNGLSD